MKKQIHNPHIQKEVGCFTNHSRKFVLINIHKNASMSLRNSLNIWEWIDYTQTNTKDSIKLCVIRNTNYRSISIYQYLLTLNDNGVIEAHPTHLTKESDFYKNRNNPIESFNQFLDEIDGGNFYDAITYPQTRFLEDKGMTINDVDEFLIHENINEDFNRLKNKYDINIDVRRDNVSDDTIKKILTDYVNSNSEVRERILSIYKMDKELYETISKTKLS